MSNVLPKDLSFLGRDVLTYLRELKKYGHRGQTSRELAYHLLGIISEQSVLKQIARLKKHKLIKQIIVKYKKYKIIIYESV